MVEVRGTGGERDGQDGEPAFADPGGKLATELIAIWSIMIKHIGSFAADRPDIQSKFNRLGEAIKLVDRPELLDAAKREYRALVRELDQLDIGIRQKQTGFFKSLLFGGEEGSSGRTNLLSADSGGKVSSMLSNLQDLAAVLARGMLAFIDADDPNIPDVRAMRNKQFDYSNDDSVRSMLRLYKEFFFILGNSYHQTLQERNELKGIIAILGKRLKLLAETSGGYNAKLADFASAIEKAAKAGEIHELKNTILRETRVLIDETGKMNTGIAQTQADFASVAGRIESLEKDLADARNRKPPRDAEDEPEMKDTGAREIGGTASVAPGDIKPGRQFDGGASAEKFNSHLTKLCQSAATPAASANFRAAVAGVILLDQFPAISGEAGRAAATLVMKTISDIANEHIRRDDFICIYSDGMFGLIVHGMALGDAVQVLDSIRGDVQRHEFIFRSRRLTVTVSASATEVRGTDTAGEIRKRLELDAKKTLADGGNRVSAA